VPLEDSWYQIELVALLARTVWFAATILPLTTKLANCRACEVFVSTIGLKLKEQLNESVLVLLLSGFSSNTDMRSGYGTWSCALTIDTIKPTTSNVIIINAR